MLGDDQRLSSEAAAPEETDTAYIANDLHVAVHEHGNGADAYLFYFEGFMPAEPESWIAQKLGIDYEPDKGESLDISSVVGSGPIPRLRRTRSENAAAD